MSDVNLVLDALGVIVTPVRPLSVVPKSSLDVLFVPESGVDSELLFVLLVSSLKLSWVKARKTRVVLAFVDVSILPTVHTYCG